jgi:hypothetical protein
MTINAAKSDLQRLLFVEETAWGETPASALTYLRHTGESLTEERQNEESKEFTGDRGVSDIFRTSVEAKGDINFEMLYGAFDDLLAGCLCSNWSADLGISGDDISCTASDNSINSVTTDLSGVTAGQWVKVSGFTTNGGTLFGRVTSVSSTKLVVAGVTLVDESAGAIVDIYGSLVRTGTVEKSFSIEKNFTDIDKVLAYRGMKVSGFSVSMAPGAIANGSFSFMGKSEVNVVGTIGTGSPIAAPTTKPMTAVDNISTIFEDDQAVSDTFFTEFSLSINPGTRTLQALAHYGAVGALSGKERITGKFSLYFVNFSQYEKYKNQTEYSLSIRMTDEDGNNLIITIPRTQTTSAEIVAGGVDTDVVAKFDFQALRVTDGGHNIQLDRFSV